MNENKIKEMIQLALSKPVPERINSKEYISNRKSENPIDTITMDVPLFIRMMEFSREDAKSDLDLHDVAEKAISLSNNGKTLTMSDYETMFGGSELDEKKLTAAEKRKKEDIVMAMKKSFKGNKGVMYAIATDKAKKLAESDMNEAQPSSNESLAKKVEEVVKSLTILHKNTSNNSNIPETDKKGLLRAFDMLKGDLEVVVTNLKGGLSESMLDEAYVPDNIKKFAKERGVSSLVNKVAGWAEKVRARITGGTAIGKNYSTLILDMGYQTGDIRINTEDETIELYGEEVNSFPEFKEVYMDKMTQDQIEHDEYTLRKERGLEENKKGWDSKKDTPEIKALMAVADDTSKSYTERDKARQKAYDLRAEMSKLEEGLPKGYWAKKIPGGKMEESYKTLVNKLEKQGKSEKASKAIAGAIASYKKKGGGKGPTAKQKSMAETIMSKLKGK